MIPVGRFGSHCIGVAAITLLGACTPQQRADALSGAIFGALNALATPELCAQRQQTIGDQIVIDVVDPDLDAACADQ